MFKAFKLPLAWSGGPQGGGEGFEKPGLKKRGERAGESSRPRLKPPGKFIEQGVRVCSVLDSLLSLFHLFSACAPPLFPSFQSTRLDIENNFNLKSLNTPAGSVGEERRGAYARERPKKEMERNGSVRQRMEDRELPEREKRREKERKRECVCKREREKEREREIGAREAQGLCESGRYFEFPFNLKYKDPSLHGPCRPETRNPLKGDAISPTLAPST